jgi:hypothetical protein
VTSPRQGFRSLCVSLSRAGASFPQVRDRLRRGALRRSCAFTLVRPEVHQRERRWSTVVPARRPQERTRGRCRDRPVPTSLVLTPTPARRALPARTIDLIRDGARPGDSPWSALLSTANSAICCGWSRAEWIALLQQARSRLGLQIRIEHDRERPKDRVLRDLLKAWSKAEIFLAENPPHDRQHFLDQVEEIAAWLQEADLAGLTGPQRVVLAHAVAVARRNGTNRPALPRREIVAATGLGERQVRTALTGLQRRGLLVCEEAGSAAGPGARRRRAALYRLPGAEARQAYMPRASLWDGGPEEEVISVGPLTGDPAGTGVISVGPPTAPPDPAVTHSINGANEPVRRLQPDAPVTNEPSAPASAQVHLSATDPTVLAELIAHLQHRAQAVNASMDCSHPAAPDPAAAAAADDLAKVLPFRARRARLNSGQSAGLRRSKVGDQISDSTAPVVRVGPPAAY